MTLHKGWVKLHRQIIDNDIWRDDPTAWRIFEYFLVSVDRETGSMRYGRLWLSKLLKMNDSTLYKAIKRLKNAKMVTQVSNNQFSTISIVNWGKYQGDGNSESTNQVTTKSHITISKNKELISNSYSFRVKYVSDTLGEDFKITPRVIEIIDKDFADYYIDNSIKKMAIHYEEKVKKPPTTMGLLNWLLKAKEFNELERRTDES